ncbi:MAG: peptidylprolyl isomerase [Gammaproteobacteria bacterium]|nr:peptidylprolyl isomerase [Gammaproteobacteria bacterium]
MTQLQKLRQAILLSVVWPLFLLQTAAVQAEIEPLDSVVAIVDEDVIVRSELNAETAKIVAALQQRGAALPAASVIDRQVLERLILNKLQLARAAKLGISISEDVLAQTIGDIVRKNNLTLSEFRQVLQADGISFNSYRQSIRDQLTIRELLEREVLKQIRVTDEELEAFKARKGNLSGRTDYHLLHILIATPEGASADQLEAARSKAQQLVVELRQGRDFSATALSQSDGQQALDGGDLGWRASGQLPTLFADKVDLMEKGEISDPIHSPSGYHIIKLADYKGGERHIIDQTRVRHILINTNEVTSNDDAKTRLEQLRQRIIGGEDFTNLARAHSDDKASAIKGGELGWVTSGDLVPRFENEMQQLEIGQLSQPFRTDFGWHIIQVMERRKHDGTEEVIKAEAKGAIRKRKFTEESELYLRRLKDEAYIVITLNDG